MRRKMSANKTCCYCLPLRHGCIIIGIVGILFDSTVLLNLFGWKACIIILISDGLLITGATMKTRLCLLPSMIIGLLVNIVLWIIDLIALYASSYVSPTILAYANLLSQGLGQTLSQIIPVIVVFLVLITVIHLLIIRNIFQHFNELGDEQRIHFQHCVTTIVSVPIDANSYPREICESEHLDGQV